MKLCLKTLTVVKTVFIFLWVCTLTVVEKVGVIVGNGRYTHVQMYAINTKGGLKMRLIDANELTEMVWRERVDSRERIAELIARQPTIKAPTADVQLVKRGHWDYSEKENGECEWYFCSECDSPAEQLYDDNPLLSEFCPHCGADMRNDSNLMKTEVEGLFLNFEEGGLIMDKVPESYKYEILHVKALGELIGYGNLMDIASVLWAEDLQRHAEPDIGAFYPVILTQIKDDELKEKIIRNRFHKIQLYKNLGIWGEGD